MPYVNPPILKVALVGPEVDALRLMYDFYGLVRLDTYPRSLFDLNASLGFEPVEPRRADCVLICIRNNTIPSGEQLETIKVQIMDRPSTLTLVVSLTNSNPQNPSQENLAPLKQAWLEALGKEVEIIPLPAFAQDSAQGREPIEEERTTLEKINARYQFLDKLKKHLIYAGLLAKHLKSDELYAVHHFPNELTNIVCEMIGNPIVEENVDSGPKHRP